MSETSCEERAPGGVVVIAGASARRRIALAAFAGAWLALGPPVRAERPLDTLMPDTAARAARPGADAREAHRRGSGPAITRRSTRSSVGGDYYLALTFDDGPDHATTPRVLDALDAYEVTATFFVVGWRFASDQRERRANAAALREVARRGYAIGNHTFDHLDLRTLDPSRAREEVARTERAVAEHLGYRPFLFRAPYGRTPPAVSDYARERGYTEVGWRVDTRDWRRQDPQQLTRRLLDELARTRGGVVLLHDTKPWTADAMPLMLASLERENCRRRATREPLLIPVSLDYFMKDVSGARRPVPPEALAHEQRYRARLATVCAPAAP